MQTHQQISSPLRFTDRQPNAASSPGFWHLFRTAFVVYAKWVFGSMFAGLLAMAIYALFDKKHPEAFESAAFFLEICSFCASIFAIFLFVRSRREVQSKIEPHSKKRKLADDFDSLESAHSRTTKGISISIAVSVVLVFCVHLASVFSLENTRTVSGLAESVDRIFDLWVPLFTGLLGTGVGFYFADRKSAR